MAGNTTTSSLIRSAQARAAKIRSQEDAFIAFQWESSAQTYDDYLEYSKFLQERASSVNDPSDQLTYQTKLRSANRSYTSNEIQRQQMAIMEGRASTVDKMETVRMLYERAITNGDYNLAQNLYSQWDSLSIKLQNEAKANSGAMAAAGEKAYKALEDKLTKSFGDVELPSGEKVTSLAAIARDLQESKGSAATWAAAQDTLEALRNLNIDRYQNATTQEQIDALEAKYGPGLADIDKNLTFSVGGLKLTAQDVVNAAANEAIGNPIYGIKAVRNEATGTNEFKLTKNNIERLDYVRQFDEEGNEYYAPTAIRTDKEKLMFGGTGEGRGLKTQINEEGLPIRKDGSVAGREGKVKRDDSLTIENRLKKLGIIAKQNGTTLTIKLPGENIERDATIQSDGSLRYFGDDGSLIEFGLVKRNLGTKDRPLEFEAGQQRIVSPDELSDFATISSFGGIQSRASKRGQADLASMMGKTPSATAAIFGGGIGSPTTNLLMSAATTRAQVQQERQRIAMQNALGVIQGSPIGLPNINTTPVRQFASNGVAIKQLAIGTVPKQSLGIATDYRTQRIYLGSTPNQSIRIGGTSSGNLTIGTAPKNNLSLW